MTYRGILNKLLNAKPLASHSSVYSSLNYFRGMPHPEQIQLGLQSQGYCLYRDSNCNTVNNLIDSQIPKIILSSYLKEPRYTNFDKYKADILMNYKHGTDDRTSYGSSILDVSDGLPSSNVVLPHSELTYTDEFPRIITFACMETDAFDQGFTPIANIIEVAKNLDPAIKDKLLKHGIKYWRLIPNQEGNYGKTWKTMFNVNNKQDAERMCQLYGYDFEWTNDDCLRLQYVKPAFIECCDRNQLSFANSIGGHHGSGMDNVPEWRDIPYHQRPFHTTYGDDTEVTKQELDYIDQLHQKYQLLFKWNVGDVLILDNLMWSHARYPYSGKRKIVTMMGLPLVRTAHTVANMSKCEYQSNFQQSIDITSSLV